MKLRRIVLRGARPGESIVLDPTDAHHVANVLRLREGTEVEIVNGDGGRFRGNYRAATTSVEVGAQLADDDRVEPITIVQALLKPTRMDWLVEKLSELGVQRLVPVIAHRSVGRPRLERWQRIARESAKQCGRASLLPIDPPVDLEPIATWSPDGETRWLLDPNGSPPTGAPSAARVVVAVGPEGGFTASEVALLVADGFACVRLAEPILRGETAAIAAAAYIAASRQCLSEH